jgi:hypothetical protein
MAAPVPAPPRPGAPGHHPGALREAGDLPDARPEAAALPAAPPLPQTGRPTSPDGRPRSTNGRPTSPDGRLTSPNGWRASLSAGWRRVIAAICGSRLLTGRHPGCGTWSRSGSRPVRSPAAGGPPSAATRTTPCPMTRAAGRVSATWPRSAAATIAPSRPAAGSSPSPSRERWYGSPRAAAAMPPGPPFIRYEAGYLGWGGLPSGAAVRNTGVRRLAEFINSPWPHSSAGPWQPRRACSHGRT